MKQEVGRIFPRMPVQDTLTYAFFGVFMRFEYALKEHGFARGGAREVSADWEGYSDAIDQDLRDIEDEGFLSAVEYLLVAPPRKQVLINGALDWKDSPPDKRLTKARQVLLMVRRVRNNLFHGAKIWIPDGDGLERNARLVQSSLIVLVGCAPLHPRVRFGLRRIDAHILEACGIGTNSDAHA
ncbi:hypothetical protein MMZ06_31600 [Burkholderia gladioli]|uniref:hypothetical protein n=1 Tax=Burkholderia gladioli TaxID=28095 RepID=UPI001F4ABB5D|nr:hypothetical protein [Burkholderia gladioli]MCH7274378.1 hypothetical protein [Burkholderia gladioli]MEB2552380.1 hypothetical protein [Burkholderia gladioli]